MSPAVPYGPSDEGALFSQVEGAALNEGATTHNCAKVDKQNLVKLRARPHAPQKSERPTGRSSHEDRFNQKCTGES